jgi:putative N6-adenine-specific DNA methylase
MNELLLFLPCASGVEPYLGYEVLQILARSQVEIKLLRGGVQLKASWREAMLLNLHSRLAQRVLIQLQDLAYAVEQDIYNAAHWVAWEIWFDNQHTFKVDITAQHSPLKSLNFALLRVKDAVADRFRERTGQRPNVQTFRPDVRIHVHLNSDRIFLYLDTSGEPLFKRGWRFEKGDAPLKETLAAAMLAASGWSMPALKEGTMLPMQVRDSTENANPGRLEPAKSAVDRGVPLYDPCCGSGTIVIEAAQIACAMASGLNRRFGFERLKPFEARLWEELKERARAQICAPKAQVFGSDISHRMVDFAQQNAVSAGVQGVAQFRAGDALQRMPPVAAPAVLMLNPPYGERIETAGVSGARQYTSTQDGGEFFLELAAHLKKNYTDWTAWVLTPDMKLSHKMRLKENRRIPMWNGPIECRLFRYEIKRGRMADA